MVVPLSMPCTPVNLLDRRAVVRDVRITVPERAGILGVLTTIFGNHGISIETILQRSPYESGGEAVADLLIKVFSVEKPELIAAIEEARASGVVKSIDNIMRVEE